jgi:CheY-like chemotaxis protein
VAQVVRNFGGTFAVQSLLLGSAMTEREKNERHARGLQEAVWRGTGRMRGSARGKVLVVDDNIPAAQGLEVLLCDEGWEVATAYDGLAAVGTALEMVPDVVLLDLALPLLDGYEVARRLRADMRLAHTRLIAVTASDDRERTRATGFVEHLVKPVMFDAVLAALASATRGARSAAIDRCRSTAGSRHRVRSIPR